MLVLGAPRMSTIAFCKVVGEAPPKDSRPHPVINAVLSSAGQAPKEPFDGGSRIGLVVALKVSGVASLSSATSLA